ncbi:MAG: hypothetical protein F2520_09840 [Actinobacteria bacterium]|uniref:Unannotated protein n=2 Tax=freshwater metagenome TaxID=449393 RepID=A0A6J5YEF4_9ZZZZ|nr:hypothetical protein [Actinomycetota bacterium]
MILWFAGVSFVFVWWVFRTPALDYRLVMLGSVLPIGEFVFGGPRLLHTLLAPVALLTIIMLATQKRRLVRRRWIGVAIGMLMHLVLDGIWARKEVFWFPFLGTDIGSGDVWTGLPEFGHSFGVGILLELIGAACVVWAWRAFDFTDPVKRSRFIRTGHLTRVVESPPTC